MREERSRPLKQKGITMKLSKKVHMLTIGLGFAAGAALIVASIIAEDGRFAAFGAAAIAGTIVMIVAGATAKPAGSLVSGGGTGGASYKVTPDWAIVAAIFCFVVAGVLSATVLKPDAPPTTNPSKQSKNK